MSDRSSSNRLNPALSAVVANRLEKYPYMTEHDPPMPSSTSSSHPTDPIPTIPFIDHNLSRPAYIPNNEDGQANAGPSQDADELSYDPTAAQTQTQPEVEVAEQRRKESHKEVEKRRRETINAGIQALQDVLPPLPFPSVNLPSAFPGASAAATTAAVLKNPNKGVILQSAAAYIKYLRQQEANNIEKWTLEKLISDQNMMELRAERDFWRNRAEKFRTCLSELGERVDVVPGEPRDGLYQATSPDLPSSKRPRIE